MKDVMAPQAGFEPATLRLTGAAQGFLMASYRCSICRTVNALDVILFFRPVAPIEPIFQGGWAQNRAQCFGRITCGGMRLFFVQARFPEVQRLS